ncbi:MAG: zinc-ribbon domain-containing protein [Candidatus Methanomethyliales bacterium]|nr:zinc-ribbon domain-containing protein [Candidatus Methanomethylicales archaeon]
MSSGRWLSIKMVYCTKCGAKNPDDVKVCAQCGASLYIVSETERRKRDEIEKECFGIPRGGAFVSLAIGIIILLSGCIWLLQQAQIIPKTVDVWPIAVMIFGILIIIGAIYGLRRR